MAEKLKQAKLATNTDLANIEQHIFWKIGKLQTYDLSLLLVVVTLAMKNHKISGYFNQF